MTKIVATIGPTSRSVDVLERFRARGVDLARINMSHTREEDIEPTARLLQRCGLTVCIDTEGSQVRTGYLGREALLFRDHAEVRLFDRMVDCDEQQLFIRPYEAVSHLEQGDLISIDFNSVLLKVADTSRLASDGFVRCRVIIGGVIGNNKAVSITNKVIQLPPFSQKDVRAIEFARSNGIRHFTLSFMDTPEEVLEFRRMYPGAIAYSKIETASGLNHLDDIIALSDGILIDRGDLSREVAIERIPLTQKLVIRRCRDAGKDVFIASNILDSMCEAMKPSRGEVNDIITSMLDGVTGLVLTKETAIGRYPVEVINMVISLRRQAALVLDVDGEHQGTATGRSIVQRIEALNYATSSAIPTLLVEPHGGGLVDAVLRRPLGDSALRALPSLAVSRERLLDAEQIAIGAFSPLRGFMGQADCESVLNTMRLVNGTVWPIPILLPVPADHAARIEEGMQLALTGEDGVVYALLTVDEKFTFSREDFAYKVYGTNDPGHPGVAMVHAMPDTALAGEVKLLRRVGSPFREYELTPAQTRRIFEERCWSTVVGFHSRNVIHRGHEHIQLRAVEQCGCDGLLVHPVIGRKKGADFQSDVIIKSYEIMLRHYYPANVVFSVFNWYSRYAGPREALLTAICRKNFGCSHFIVGRDHAGTGSFYPAYASQAIFDRFPDLGIVPVRFTEIVYCPDRCTWDERPRAEEAQEEVWEISGTRAREYLRKGLTPPEWLMRPEVGRMLLDETMANGIFVE